MALGAVLHDISLPATNTAIDEIESLRHCRSVSFHLISKNELLADPQALRDVDVLLCSSSFNPSRRPYETQILDIIAKYPGITVLTLQDEHGNVEAQREWIRISGASVVITMAQEPLLQSLYPFSEFGHIRFLSALPGYVPERLEGIPTADYAQRPIDISYRGRYQGFGTGTLGQDKHRVGELLLNGLLDSGLNLDIDPFGVRRVNGSEWDALLQSSKAALGVESGSSLIDWDGSITSEIHRFHQRNPRATFSDVVSSVYRGRDWLYTYTTASPRVFEYAANGCLLLLTEGRHSEIVDPWRHYVPVKRDGSNLDEVESAVRNPVLWAELTANARKDLINSGRYSWRVYAQMLDEALESLGIEPNQVDGLEHPAGSSLPPSLTPSRHLVSQPNSIDLRQFFRMFIPRPLRTWLWGLRADARGAIYSTAAWINAGFPWLVKSRSIGVARDACTVWCITRASPSHGDFVPSFSITALGPDGAAGRFEGVLQILSGFETWSRARAPLTELPSAASRKHRLMRALERLLHPIQIYLTPDPAKQDQHKDS